MANTVTIQGREVIQPEGMTKGGMVDMLVQQGKISPNDAAMELQMEIIDPASDMTITEAQ